MEKLLQLLNEYQPLESKNQEYCIEGTELYIKTKVYAEADDYLNYTPWVISKKFGFIYWLWSKGKIRYMEDWEFLGDDHGGSFTEYETRLMYLAIQDEPINFLVSILK